MHRKACRSKHQHWVPQFYLRYFATPESRDTKKPQVWIFSKDLQDGDEQLTSVRNVCGKRYLYSPRQLDGSRSWALDDKLSDVEAFLGLIWPALATDFVDLADEHIRKALSLFVATTHMRHPDIRDAVEETHSKLIEFVEAGRTHAGGTPIVEADQTTEKSHEIDASSWQTYKTLGKDGHDQEFVELVQSEVGRMAQHLLTKRWSVLLSERDVFVTSDKPVVITHLARVFYGYGSKEAIIMFPLSPSRLLVLDDLHNEPANQYYPLKESNIGAINLTTWNSSRRFLITGRPIPEVLHELNALSENSNDE